LLNPEMETYANMTPEDNVEVKKENKTPNPTEETISEPTIEDIPFDDKSF